MIERYRFSEGVSGGGFAPDEPPMMEGDIQGDWVKYDSFIELKSNTLEFAELFLEFIDSVEVLNEYDELRSNIQGFVRAIKKNF